MDTYGELDFDSILIFAQNFDELSNLAQYFRIMMLIKKSTVHG